MSYWIERFTNRITMEKLVLYCLFAIFAVAVLLSIFGLVSYSPLSLLASFAVLVFVSYGVNIALGHLYGVAVSYESPVITAMILGFLIAPTLDLLGLATLALTAIIAMSSKFVLAIRGRHIFNPAAIAVVIVGFTGLQYAVWWVATPVLLPVVLLGALLILYKTRHIAMGSVFFVTAATTIILSGIISGSTIGFVIGSVVLSWPLVFFAGYMLSEPLTLPPRRWQKMLLAVIAGLGVALPFHIGAFSTAPEIILVLLNFAAFLFGQRQGVRLTLSSVSDLTPTTKEFHFTPQSPLRFTPGQYMEVHVPQEKPDSRGSRRSFSIVGIPGGDTLSIATKIPENASSYKKALVGLETGSVLTATRISGDFVLPKNIDVPIVFIAGGIGITPFVSHVRSIIAAGESRNITLIYSVSDSKELAYIDTFVQAHVRIIVITNDIQKQQEGVTYISEKYASKEALAKAVPTYSGAQVYVSGPPMMVESVTTSLRKLGARSIHRDYFNGY